MIIEEGSSAELVIRREGALTADSIVGTFLRADFFSLELPDDKLVKYLNLCFVYLCEKV